MAKKRPVMPPALVANDPPPPRLAPPAAVEVEAITQRAIAAAVEQRVSERIQPTFRTGLRIFMNIRRHKIPYKVCQVVEADADVPP